MFKVLSKVLALLQAPYAARGTFWEVTVYISDSSSSPRELVCDKLTCV